MCRPSKHEEAAIGYPREVANADLRTELQGNDLWLTAHLIILFRKQTLKIRPHQKSRAVDRRRPQADDQPVPIGCNALNVEAVLLFVETLPEIPADLVCPLQYIRKPVGHGRGLITVFIFNSIALSVGRIAVLINPDSGQDEGCGIKASLAPAAAMRANDIKIRRGISDTFTVKLVRVILSARAIRLRPGTKNAVQHLVNQADIRAGIKSLAF